MNSDYITFLDLLETEIDPEDDSYVGNLFRCAHEYTEYNRVLREVGPFLYLPSSKTFLQHDSIYLVLRKVCLCYSARPEVRYLGYELLTNDNDKNPKTVVVSAQNMNKCFSYIKNG